jgi:hypothetical protein
MIKFGKYALITPVTHPFEKEPELFWIIAPPTSGDELNLSQFLAIDRLVMMPDGTRVSRPAVNLEVAHREIALTFGGTNIAAEDGQPILTSESTVDEIEEMLRAMPLEMVKEIWKAIADSVPGWGPVQPKEKNPKN